MNAEEGADIRAFLAHLQRLAEAIPLRPVDQQRNIPGRALVEALADSDSEQPAYWTPTECAEVLQLLCSLSPRPGQCYCEDHSAMDGYGAVMDHLHDSVRMTSAMLAEQGDPPVKPGPYLVIDNTREPSGHED